MKMCVKFQRLTTLFLKSKKKLENLNFLKMFLDFFQDFFVFYFEFGGKFGLVSFFVNFGINFEWITLG